MGRITTGLPYLISVRCTSIINDAVNLAKFLICNLHDVFPVGSLGDIAANELTLEFVRRLLANIFCKVRNDHFCAFVKKLLGNALAKTSTSACYNGYFAVKTSWHDELNVCFGVWCSLGMIFLFE